jgi:hypothetical protein
MPLKGMSQVACYICRAKISAGIKVWVDPTNMRLEEKS